MRGRALSILAAALAAAVLCVLVTTLVLRTRDGGPRVPRSHRDLDWNAPSRWVHVDNLDPAKAASFVSARRGWLAVLRRDGELLGDGRALFWHASSSPAGETFFSFYPFSSWADLEARGRMIDRTEGIVGEAAVTAYDSGDGALVAPHYSQIWRRLGDFDIVSPATQGLTEVTANAGRIEVHSVDIRRWEELERAWRRVREALAAAEYPLACRAFRATYGRGEVVLWWVAADAASYEAAPPLAALLERQLGAQGTALRATVEEILPLEESLEVERRADLSNLGSEEP